MFKKNRLSKAEMKTVLGNDIGDDIRKYRDEKCLTQSYIANKLGIGQSAYQKIESGDTKVSIDRLKQIADILGKPIDVFLNKDDAYNSLAERDSSTSMNENEMLKKLIIHQEKRIEELEEKLKRKNQKIEELKNGYLQGSSQT